MHSANNLLQFHESTLAHLGDKIVSLLRADSGFFDEAILTALEAKRIPYIVAARLTQPLQRTIYQATGLVGAGAEAEACRAALPGGRLDDGSRVGLCHARLTPHRRPRATHGQ